MKTKVSLIVALLLSLHAFCIAQETRSSPITVDELRSHIKYLASDQLEGRRAGSKGADLASEYIAREFSAYGLRPLGDAGTYFQVFEFNAGVRLGNANSFAVRSPKKGSPLKLDVDYRPLGFSPTGKFEGGAAFVGYGIAFAEKGYDDYQGIDVKDKAVIVLRYHPEGDNQHSEFNQYASLRYKASKAKERGAKAFILVTGPADEDNDELLKLSFDQSGSAGIPSVCITRKIADEWFKPDGKSLKELQEKINGSKTPQSFELPNFRLSLRTEVHEIRKKTRNVVGFLEGNDASLKSEVVVVGAHYDHLGLGGEGSGSLRPDTVAVHNGADDNGSGTAGLLELSQYFSAARSALKRSMLFLAFSGEELGLLGSAHFVSHPPLPLDRMVTMLNMDMIGRLTERKLIVYGIGTSPSFDSLARKYKIGRAHV